MIPAKDTRRELAKAIPPQALSGAHQQQQQQQRLPLSLLLQGHLLIERVRPLPHSQSAIIVALQRESLYVRMIARGIELLTRLMQPIPSLSLVSEESEKHRTISLMMPHSFSHTCLCCLLIADAHHGRETREESATDDGVHSRGCPMPQQ